MTKRRPALSFNLALTKIAGTIGWGEIAKITRQAESTVRNWSDPDTGAGITMEHALALDVAYQAAGGDGAPLFQCYSTRLEIETAAALYSVDALALSTAALAKESGEAIASAIEAARPGATPQQRARAELELEEMLAAGNSTLAKVRAGRAGVATEGES